MKWRYFTNKKHLYKYVVVFLFFWGGQQENIFGQTRSKLNIDLFRLAQGLPQKNAIHALVEGNTTKIQQLVESLGGEYKYAVGNIASVQFPLDKLEPLLGSPDVKRVEASWGKLKDFTFREDTAMLENNNLTPVHEAWGDLPEAFQGQGVLLGIIDDGYEWKHPDFLMDDSNSTRILYLWDQASTDLINYEGYYGYGAAWDSSLLNQNITDHQAGTHGTHVLGSAAGNARANGKYIGVAPMTDILAVSINESSNSFLSSFVDGVHYIFKKADSLNRPCVINSSVGTYGGAHDAKDLNSRLLANILNEKPGRVLVQAAGNAGHIPLHSTLELNQSNKAIAFEYYKGRDFTHFMFYVDSLDALGLNFSVQLRDKTNNLLKLGSSNMNLVSDFTFTGSIAQKTQVLQYDNQGNPIVSMILYVDFYGGRYSVYARINGTQDNRDKWFLDVQGTGKIDVYSRENELGTSNILDLNLPNVQGGDYTQNLAGYWVCANEVISVGAYQNRDTMIAYNGDTVKLSIAGHPRQEITHFSSWGPTRDLRMKPDLTAPGGGILSASTFDRIQLFKQSNNTRLDQGGMHYEASGTSMSSPMVAGAVALYLQCQPLANWQEVKNKLQTSTKRDSFVYLPSFPNNRWGYGKLDVYALMQSCLVYGCMDSTAANYNPLANVDDGACLILHQEDGLKQGNYIRLISNPTTSSNIELDYLLDDKTELRVYNTLGQLNSRYLLPLGNQRVSLLLEGGSQGVYWLVFEQEGKIIANKKYIKI